MNKKIFDLQIFLCLYKMKKFFLIIEDLPGEVLKDVENYEGVYLVSNKSRIKSFSAHRQVASAFIPNSEKNLSSITRTAINQLILLKIHSGLRKKKIRVTLGKMDFAGKGTDLKIQM